MNTEKKSNKREPFLSLEELKEKINEENKSEDETKNSEQ